MSISRILNRHSKRKKADMERLFCLPNATVDYINMVSSMSMVIAFWASLKNQLKEKHRLNTESSAFIFCTKIFSQHSRIPLLKNIVSNVHCLNMPKTKKL